MHTKRCVGYTSKYGVVGSLVGFVETVFKQRRAPWGLSRQGYFCVWFALNVCQSRCTFSGTCGSPAGARCFSPALAASTSHSFTSHRVIFSKWILLPLRERQCEFQLEARVSFPWEIKSPQCWHGLSGYYWSNPGWAVTTAANGRETERGRDFYVCVCFSVLLHFQSHFK